MKQEEVIVGIVVIVVGAIFFFMGDSMNTPFDSRGGFLMVLGIVFVIAGLIVSVIGATSEGMQKKPMQQSRARYCPNCGRSIPFDAKICPYCKKDFEQKTL